MTEDAEYLIIEDFLRSHEKSFLLLSAGRKEYDRLQFQLSDEELQSFLASTGNNERVAALKESLRDKGQKEFTYARSRHRVSSTIYTCEQGDVSFKSFRGRGDTLGWSLHKLQKEVDTKYELPGAEFSPDIPQMMVNAGWNIRVDAMPEKFLFTTFIPRQSKSDGYHAKHVVGRMSAPTIIQGLEFYNRSGLEKETLDMVVQGLKRPGRHARGYFPVDASDRVLQLYHIGANNQRTMDALYTGLKQLS